MECEIRERLILWFYKSKKRNNKNNNINRGLSGKPYSDQEEDFLENLFFL